VIATFPAPPGTEIGVGPLQLRAYGLMIALGVIAAVWLFGRRLEQKGIGTREDATAISTWSVAAGLIGARLYHVVTDWDRFSDDLGSIPAVWEGGLGIPGGLIAGIAVGLYVVRRRGLPMAQAATCAAPALPLAQAIGRWGNWFNQELFGRPTDLPWALEVDPEHVPAAYAVGTTFHPTFLYESLWNLGLCGLLLWIDRQFRLGPGRLLAVYVMLYGLGRFWVEGLRIDPADELGGLRWNQWVALGAVVGGALYLIATHGQKWPEPAEVAVERDAATPSAEPVDASENATEEAAELAVEPNATEPEPLAEQPLERDGSEPGQPAD
jgi:prolipoprotein diacylglyceryl transferase